MSEAVGVAVRRRRSRVEADRLVLEFERSGLTRQAFCAQHGLSIAALDKYRRRCALELKPAQPWSAENRILPVEFVASISPAQAPAVGSRRALWVELANGRRIEVADGFDGSTLERLVAVLEGACGNRRLPGFSSQRKS
jgi:hypothetical protein